MDEAQDLFSAPVLDVLNRSVGGGIAGGRWAIFGDFTRQALFGRTDDPLQLLSDYCDHFTRARLTLNCRNTRRIALETVLMSGFEDLPFRLSQDEGLPVEHRYWENSSDLADTLGEVIDRLLDEGTKLSDIVILSPRRLENSALAKVSKIARRPLNDITTSNPLAGI